MWVFLNGEFVPEDRAMVSVFDRSFLYGDGLFETLRVLNGQPFRWAAHWQRLEQGAGFLRLRLPFARATARNWAGELFARNNVSDGLLRLTLSRGVGVRGFSPREANRPLLVMTTHPAPPIEPQPPQWRVVTSSFHLPANEPLARFKTCNKLPQVLARAEADDHQAQEALLLNTDGYVVEASSSNLFWIDQGRVCTPPLASGILAGVTRSVIEELCVALGLPCLETLIRPEELGKTDGVFLSLSTVGITEVVTLDEIDLARSPLPGTLYTAYNELLRRETR